MFVIPTYATVVNLTLESVAALVCEGFVIARNYQIYSPSWKTFGKSCKNIYVQKKDLQERKTYCIRQVGGGGRVPGRPEKKK